MNNTLRDTKAKYGNKDCLIESIKENNMDDFLILLQDPNLNIDALEDNIRILSAAALHRAVQGLRIEMVRILLDFQANPNVLDGKGRTPLHYLNSNSEDSYDDESVNISASINKSFQITNMLLQQPTVNINARDDTGRTPLQLCVYSNNSWQMFYFIRRHAYLDNQDDLGETALHAAAKMGRRDMVQTLLVNGANIHLLSGSGLKADELANLYHERDIGDLIKTFYPRFEHTDCLICHEPLRNTVTKRLPCGHGFHLVCINEWNIHNITGHIGRSTCPTCRRVYDSLFMQDFSALAVQRDGTLRLKL